MKPSELNSGQGMPRGGGAPGGKRSLKGGVGCKGRGLQWGRKRLQGRGGHTLGVAFSALRAALPHVSLAYGSRHGLSDPGRIPQSLVRGGRGADSWDRRVSEFPTQAVLALGPLTCL